MSRKHKDPLVNFGKVRLELRLEVEPPEYDEEDNDRLRRLGQEHKVTHKHTEILTGTKLFTAQEVDQSDGEAISLLMIMLMREAFQKAAERVRDEAFYR